MDTGEPDRPHLLAVTEDLVIPLSEIEFRFSRSGGAGGQHVNRTATRVEALFDVANSPSLSDSQRAKLLHRLESQLDSEGVLRIVAQSERSQYRNRQDALRRLQEVLRRGLWVRKRRRGTPVPKWAKERRLAEKRRRGEKKQQRGRVRPGDY